MKMQIRNGNIIQTRLASGREGGTHQISYHVLHVNILIVSCVEYRNSPDPLGFCVLGMYGVGRENCSELVRAATQCAKQVGTQQTSQYTRCCRLSETVKD